MAFNKIETIKRCSKCKQEYPPTTKYFYRNRKHKDGLRSCCKQCDNCQERKEQKSQYYKQYYKTHREKKRQYCKQWCQEHRTERLQYHHQYGKRYRKTLQGHLKLMWDNMLKRCNNPKIRDYKYYGGRGIEVKFISFDDFYNYVVNELKADPRGLTVDRIDNDGHYKRGNIRFVSQAENNRNKRAYGN